MGSSSQIGSPRCTPMRTRKPRYGPLPLASSSRPSLVSSISFGQSTSSNSFWRVSTHFIASRLCSNATMKASPSVFTSYPLYFFRYFRNTIAAFEMASLNASGHVFQNRDAPSTEVNTSAMGPVGAERACSASFTSSLTNSRSDNWVGITSWTYAGSLRPLSENSPRNLEVTFNGSSPADASVCLLTTACPPEATVDTRADRLTIRPK
mmetsp:Transcript_3784/g.10430  ORF Transcript_3784/g.10430 Transcript_3784/m.10430 type:complete len:208 (-) Transcript_3784:1720-2343(-)